MEKAVLAVADKLPRHRWLSSVPGVSRILGMVITMETGPVGRFASAGDYASYCRCVQSVRLSNGKAKGRNNGKNGNAYLAWAWVEAAQYARRYYPACGQFYDRKETEVNGTLSTKALACKLAKAAWHVMTDQVEFDLKRVFPNWRSPSQASERGVGSNPEGASQVRAAEAAAAPPPPHRPAPAQDPTSLASLGDVSLRASPAGQKPKQKQGKKKKKAMKKHQTILGGAVGPHGRGWTTSHRADWGRQLCPLLTGWGENVFRRFDRVVSHQRVGHGLGLLSYESLGSE